MGGKGSGGRNRRPLEERTCLGCGATFMAKPFAKKKYCEHACYARSLRGKFREENSPSWRGGIQTYRRYRKDACERCGSDRHLVVHHKDEDRYNNALENLETLCKRCHQMHHECWQNLPSP